MKSFAEETPMKPGEGAVIVLALTRHECEEGVCKTSSMVQGTGYDLKQLLFHTLVKEDKMRFIVLEAMKSHLLKSIIPDDVLKGMARRKNPGCDGPNTADPDAPVTDREINEDEAKA